MTETGSDARGELDELTGRLQRARQELEAAHRQIEALRRDVESAHRQIEVVSRDAAVARRELDTLAYSVSHDLSAPLRAIQGFYQIFVEDYQSSVPPEGLRVLERVNAGARRLSEMLGSLLVVSRISRHPLALEKLDLDALLARLSQPVQGAAAGRRIEWNIGPLGQCTADPTLAADLFERLLSNAQKFTRQRDPAVIEIGRKQDAGQRVYFVRDNGVGFKMEYASKLFGVFQRLHPEVEFEGAGVGLAIVQRVINRHGGRIWAESSPGAGATFYFTLEPASVDGAKALGRA